MITAIRKWYLELLVVPSVLGLGILWLTGNLHWDLTLEDIPSLILNLVLFGVPVFYLIRKWSQADSSGGEAGADASQAAHREPK